MFKLIVNIKFVLLFVLSLIISCENMSSKKAENTNNSEQQQAVAPTPVFSNQDFWQKMWDARQLPFHKLDRHP
jgi:hypothetical protein